MLFTVLSAVSFFLEHRERERAAREARNSYPDYRGPLHEMSDIVLKATNVTLRSSPKFRNPSSDHKGKQTFEHRTSATENNCAVPKQIEIPDVQAPVAIEPAPKAKETVKLSDSEKRRRAWESGNMDYMGADSFDNIMKKLNESMGCRPSYYS